MPVAKQMSVGLDEDGRMTSWSMPSSQSSERSRPWELTAPESYVLRYAPVTRVGVEAFKLALQELVVRGALQVVPAHTPRRLGLGRGRRSLIAEGHRFGGCAEPALVPILELYRNTGIARVRIAVASGADGECEGIPLEHFAKAARKAFGGYRGYVDSHVAAALEQRGLFHIERYVGLSNRSLYSYTAAGRRADDELEEWLQEGKRSQGSALLRGAGAAILLLHQMDPQLRVAERLFDARRRGAAEPVDPAVLHTVRLEPPTESDTELAAPPVDDTFAFEQLDGVSLDFAFAAIDLAIRGGGGGGGDGGGGGGDGGGGDGGG